MTAAGGDRAGKKKVVKVAQRGGGGGVFLHATQNLEYCLSSRHKKMY